MRHFMVYKVLDEENPKGVRLYNRRFLLSGSDGSLLPVGFGYPGPFTWSGPIPSVMNLIMELDEAFF
jgi:hypothetical protein